MIKKNKNYGFSLVELLVVIAIIGILSGITFASFGPAKAKARDSKRISDIKQLQLALEMYAEANGNKYPTSLSSLSSFINPVPTFGPKGASADSYKYAYYPSSNPTSYHLGAVLEDVNNSSLQSTSNCDSRSATATCPENQIYSSGFNGKSDTCGNANNSSATTDLCFDFAR